MKNALITGAGRKEGMGFEVARQLASRGYQVILTARNPHDLNKRVEELRNEGYSVTGIQLDLTNDESMQAAVSFVNEHYGKLDILINNAVYFGDYEQSNKTDFNKVKIAFDTNFLGAWKLIELFHPLLKLSSAGRIVNVSSGAGSFNDPVYGMVHGSLKMPVSTYSLTKLALNGLTVKFAKEFSQDGILVNSVCPDVVDTHPGLVSMGGRSVEDGAKSIVWGALLPDDGPTGGFYRDGLPLPW